MADIRLRTARSSDLGTVVAFSHALFREDAGTRDPFTNRDWAQEEGDAYFARRLAVDAALTLIADAGDRPVGYVTGYVQAPNALRPVAVAELESMYVEPAFRGRGVGARLAGAFLEWGRDRGARRAAVTAYAANEDALRFYRRLGFEPKNVGLERSV